VSLEPKKKKRKKKKKKKKKTQKSRSKLEGIEGVEGNCRGRDKVGEGVPRKGWCKWTRGEGRKEGEL